MIHRFFQWLRILTGACPKCNSDAPECYTCPVCEDHRGSYPSEGLKNVWRCRMTKLRMKEKTDD